MYLYCVGFWGNWPGYRIISLVTGIGTVAVAGLIGRRRNTASALMATLLVGFSYVLVLYSSEARGYASVIFFSLLSFYCLDCYLENRRWQAALCYSLSTIFGLLSHLTFVSFLLAAMVWSGCRLIKLHVRRKQLVVAFLSCHGAAIVLLGVLYLVDIRHMVFGGGTPTSLSSAYAAALTWALGAPFGNSLLILTCLGAVLVFAAGIRMLWRQRADSLVFYVGVIPLFPLLLTAVQGSDVIYVRYFIVAIAFFLILFSFVLADLYARGGGKTICGVLLVAYLAANGRHMASLFEFGRGSYCEAIRFLAKESDRQIVTVGSDHDDAIGWTLPFYAWAAGCKKVKYYQQGHWPRQGPEWVISGRESFDDPLPRASQLRDDAGNRYEFVKTFPTAPLSGLHWLIYHNQTMSANRTSPEAVD